MKNPFKNLFRTTMMLGTGAIASAFANGETVKLVNKKTGFVVVEFTNGKTTFYDRFLEPEMREMGIPVPPQLMAEYGGKENILLDDELFEKAFREIYFPYYIPQSIYELLNS